MVNGLFEAECAISYLTLIHLWGLIAQVFEFFPKNIFAINFLHRI